MLFNILCTRVLCVASYIGQRNTSSFDVTLLAFCLNFSCVIVCILLSFLWFQKRIRLTAFWTRIRGVMASRPAPRHACLHALKSLLSAHLLHLNLGPALQVLRARKPNLHHIHSINRSTYKSTNHVGSTRIWGIRHDLHPQQRQWRHLSTRNENLPRLVASKPLPKWQILI